MAGRAILGEYELTIAEGEAQPITVSGSGSSVVYQFHGDNAADCKLVQSADSSAGHIIKAGTITISGPHSVAHGPRFVYSAAGDTITVSVQEVSL